MLNGSTVVGTVSDSESSPGNRYFRSRILLIKLRQSEILRPNLLFSLLIGKTVIVEDESGLLARRIARNCSELLSLCLNTFSSLFFPDWE